MHLSEEATLEGPGTFGPQVSRTSENRGGFIDLQSSALGPTYVVSNTGALERSAHTRHCFTPVSIANGLFTRKRFALSVRLWSIRSNFIAQPRSTRPPRSRPLPLSLGDVDQLEFVCQPRVCRDVLLALQHSSQVPQVLVAPRVELCDRWACAALQVEVDCRHAKANEPRKHRLVELAVLLDGMVLDYGR